MVLNVGEIISVLVGEKDLQTVPKWTACAVTS